MSLPTEIARCLRPHQIAPAERLLEILRAHKSGLDLSVTGSGKTFVAAAVASALKKPFLVVAPKISLTQWERAGEHFGDSFSILSYEHLRYGSTQFGKWKNGPPPPRAERERYSCANCQTQIDPKNLTPCYAHHLGIHCIETKIKPHNYGQFNFHPGVEGIIFDEIHKAGRDSLNADLVCAAKRQNKTVLGLSATIASSPLHLRAIGYLLGLHQLWNFESWCRDFGVGKLQHVRGLHWLASKEEQKEAMVKIRSLILPDRGVRLTEKDIPNFPACQILAELYDLPEEGTKELDELYLQVESSLASLSSKMENDVSPDLGLTKLLRARQKIELLKVPIAAELGRDSLEKGFSVVWFVNFRATIDELKRRFPKALIIDGSPESVKVRQKNVDKFQNNLCRELIVNIDAGGACLSLQDLHGDFPRDGLVMPCHSAVSFRQLVGRLPRDGGKSPVRYRVLFASKSVEVPMHRALAGKLNNLDALNDSDLQAQNLGLKVV